MTMNFAPVTTSGNLNLKPDVGMAAYDNGPIPIPAAVAVTSTSNSNSGSVSNSIFGLGLGLGRNSLNGGGSGITCKVCGKHEYVSNGEFETIKLGDLFPNMSSSALSSPVAATTVAVGLCTNCSKGHRSSINPIFQQAAAVIKSERKSSSLLQQSQTPTMFRSWNSTNSNNTSTITNSNNDRREPTSTNQYSPKGRHNFIVTATPTVTGSGTAAAATSTTNRVLGPLGSLPVSVLSSSTSTPRKKNSNARAAGLSSTIVSSSSSSSSIVAKSEPSSSVSSMPMALNLNLLASASVLSSEGLVMGKKSSPPALTAMASSTTTPSTSTSTSPAKRNVSRDCSICNRTFKSAKIAEQHLKRVHNNVGSYCCDICGALFSYRGSLDSHLASHKPPAVTHDCPTCGQKFKEKANLNTHLKLHSDTPKRFKCQFCPSGFSKKVNLKTHTKRKHPDQVMNTGHNNSEMQPGPYNGGGGMGGQGPFGYPSTSATSTTPSTAAKPPGRGNNNNNSDRPEGNFKCDHCGRAFLFKNNLKAHLRTHTRDRKYTCEICEKSFIYKESLKNHMLLHSNEVPYQCDICLKKFRDRSNRRKHVKNVHKYMFINGDSSSLAPIGSRTDTAVASSTTSAMGVPGAPPAKKTRRRNNKSTSGGTDEVKPKRSRKPKNSSSASEAAGSINTVIVSNASCSDQERKIIMSPGPKMTITGQQQQQQQQQSLEYNLHSQNLPVTVHVPSTNSLFGRNVIVKASTSDIPLPRFSDQYNRDSSSNPSAGGTPMQQQQQQQQNVIVYPKPKHSFLESYAATEPITQSSSVISQQHLSQYYTSCSPGGLPIGVAYPEPNSSSYGSLMVPSPRSTTPQNNNPNSFDSYVIATNRRNSNGSGGNSKSPDNSVGNVQYSTSPGQVFSNPGGPIKTDQPYFWASVDNVNVNVNHSHGSPYSYNSPQNSTTPTPGPISCIDSGVNVLNTVSYSQAPELIVGGMDPSVSTSTTIPAVPNTATSSNPNSFYYKDFDFSYL